MIGRIFAVLFLTANVLAQVAASNPRYQIVNADKPEKFLAELEKASRQGYRWLMGYGCSNALLEYVTTPPETYRYIIGEVDAFELRSFRQVSRFSCGIGVLAEKAPIPHNYHYGKGDTSGKIKVAGRAGSRFMVPAGFHLRTDGLVEADGEPGMRSPDDNLSREYVLFTEPHGRIETLNAFGAEGYRVAAADGFSFYMAKVPLGRFEYMEVKVDKSPFVVEQRLNQEGSRSFRLSVTNSRPLLLERNLDDAVQYRFRVLTAQNSQDELDQVARDGFSPAAAAVNVGWGIRGMYIWQKVVEPALAKEPQ